MHDAATLLATRHLDQPDRLGLGQRQRLGLRPELRLERRGAAHRQAAAAGGEVRLIDLARRLGLCARTFATRPDRPRRWTLPITALRVTPWPMRAAIWLAVKPSDHAFQLLDAIVGPGHLVIGRRVDRFFAHPESLFVRRNHPVVKPIHMTENATSRSLLQRGYKIAETHRNNLRGSIPAFPQIAEFSQKLLKG